MSFLFLLCFVTLTQCQLRSPCPNVFQYRTDSFDNLFGYIEVPTPNSFGTRIRLDVQFSVGNAVHGSNGNIQLTAGRLNTLEDILNRRNIRYNVNLPYWIRIPPQVTEIVVNDRVLCTGPPISRRLVSVLSTVNLQHTLTVSVPLGFDKTSDQDNEIIIISQNPATFDPPLTPTIDKFQTTSRPATTRPDVVCGVPHQANSLIQGGNSFRKGSHPWLGALFTQKQEGLSFTCGSTLVSKRHAITAGHCVNTKKKRYRAEELWVVLGRENIQRWSNDGAQIVQAETVHVHPDFKFSTADGDVAVIVLSEDVIFSTLIRPVCLWQGDADIRNIINQVGVVAGWGRDDSGFISSEPKESTFPVVSGEECLRSNSAFWDLTSNRTFCAGYRDNSGPCNGDSGGGFLMQINGRWTLRGIVSMSLATTEGKCDLQQYVVFSDIAQYSQWLLSIVSN